MLVDVHAHLDHPLFNPDLDEVINRAQAAGIKSIITNGLDKKTNRNTLSISKRYQIVKPALGIYPPDALKKEIAEDLAGDINTFDIDEEIEFIKKNVHRIAAIGEVGLDYKYGSEKRLQKEVFSSLIEIAIKAGKPVIVHTRKAEADAIEILLGYGYKKTILHSFCGKKKLILKSADSGFSFSIPTNVVRSEQFKEMVKNVPMTKLLTETDAPYLSPFRDKRNEPAFIKESIETISKIKGMEQIETENAIFMNYQNMF